MNSTHRLRELSHPALRHDRIVSPIYLPNLPKLGLRVGRTAHSKVSRQRDSVIVTQRELLSTLVLEIEDKLRILAVLASEDVFPLKNGRVQLRATVEHEAFFHNTLGVFATEHLSGAIITGTLRVWKR